jgi:hypothetical protein
MARQPVTVSEPAVAASDPVPVELSHAERMRLRQEMVARQQPETTTPHRRAVDGSVVSGMELAAALQGPADAGSRSRRGGVLNVALFLLVLIGGAAAVLLYVKPEYRAPTAAWIQGTWDTVRSKLAALQWTSPPGEPPAVAVQPPKPSPKPVVTAPAAPVQQPPEKATDDASQPRLASDSAPPRNSPQKQPDRLSDRPERSERVIEQPKSIERAIEEARALWVQAIDAEARQDFNAAVKCYEQIKQLPPGAWPGGLQVSLDLAKKRASPAARAQ